MTPRLQGSDAPLPRLVYDGECPLCTGLTRWYVRLGWVSADRRVALQDVEPGLLAQFLAAGIRNEMVTYDPRTGEILTGVAGIVRLLEGTRARPLARLLSLPGLRPAAEVAYRFVGYNRRFLSTPRPRGLRCACEPDEQPVYNAALLVLALLASAACSWVFSCSVGLARETGAPDPRWIGAALLVPFVLVPFAPAGLRLRTGLHLAVGLARSALVLLLGAGLAALAAGLLELVSLAGALLLASLALARDYRRRLRYLQLPRQGLALSLGTALGALALGLDALASLWR